MCDWCGTVHAGDAANCPTEENTDGIPEDTDNDVRIFRYVQNAVKSITEGVREQMDLSKHKSGKQRGSFENRPWLNGSDLPKKGGVLKIDAIREPKKKGATVCYVDVTLGKKKFTWSLRKGFTLDAMIESLGANTDHWIGKSVKVVPGGDEGQYVNVAS